MVKSDRWRRKITAFLHDPPGKALVLRSTPHLSHEQLAENLQRLALGGDPMADNRDRAKQADRIASAADRANWLKGLSAYWDRVPPLLVHPLGADGPQEVPLPPGISLEGLDDEVQEAVGHSQSGLIAEWRTKPHNAENDKDKEKILYLHLWRLLYEELARRTSLTGWVRLLPADTRQPDHPLEQHLSITAAIADALPQPAFLVFSIGPVQDFIANARRTQDLWMGSWLLSYLAWKAIETLADAYGPDVLVYPSLRGQPLCDFWLYEAHDLPCKPSVRDTARPTFPNKFVALLPGAEAEGAARNAEEALRRAWEDLAHGVYERVKQLGFPADSSTDAQWQAQTEAFFEVFWGVLPWMGHERRSEEERAEAVKACYEEVLNPDPRRWGFARVYEVFRQSGQYPPNWGTVYSLLYELADRAFAARKGLRDFLSTEELGEKCTICGQRAALRSESQQDAREFWQAFAEALRGRGRYDLKPEGKERLCAVCTVKRFAQREVLEERLGLRGGFPSTSEIAAAPFKGKILKRLGEDPKVVQALEAFLRAAYPHLAGVGQGAVPYLERQKEALSGDVKELAERLLRIDGEWLFAESWTPERLREVWPDAAEEEAQKGRKALRELYEALGEHPSKYYALLYMDGDHMGRWVSGTHKKLATFADTLHPSVREPIRNGSDPNRRELLGQKRLVTPAVHATISQGLGHFALRLVPHIVEERYPGRLIYAGGDDVLALVPMEDALPVARELRAAFSGHIRFENGELEVCLNRPVTGYVARDRGGEVFATMGPRATASIGMALAHHLQPLDLVLEAARQAEKAAKTEYHRNALVVEALKRSGETIRAGIHWTYEEIDSVSILQEVARELGPDGGLSGKWPHGVFAEAPVLAGIPRDAQKAELKRLIQRQRTPAEREVRRAETLAEKLIRLADHLQRHGREAPSGIEELSRWLLICAFIARRGEV